jgi:15-cis-phytoene synthase
MDMTAQSGQQIFKTGSQTYYNSSLFFPKKIREDVTTLYAFVRVADDFVDSNPQDSASFYRFKSDYDLLMKEQDVETWEHTQTLKNFVALSKKYEFKPAWAEAFLQSMEWDLLNKQYLVFDDTDAYIYGSANVVGLFMAKIMGLPEQSYDGAESLGWAFQYINFIRDICEDVTLNRCYFPKTELKKYNLEAPLSYESVMGNQENFTKFVRAQLNYYSLRQKEAEKTFKFIPYRYRVAVKTASDMYAWTGQQIFNNPMVIFETKVKPSKRKIILSGLRNLVGV